MNNLDLIITYWRNSCSDADRMGIDYRIVKSAPTVPVTEVVQGRVRPEVVAALFKDTVVPERDIVQSQRVQIPRTLDILVCPIVGRRRPERGVVAANIDEVIMPLWVPAVLHESGELRPQDDSAPWIARNMLEPTDRATIIVGTVEGVDRFLSSQQRPGAEDGWPEYWSYCCRMFHDVTGCEINSFSVPEYDINRTTAHVLAADTVQGSGIHIIKLYDRIMQEQCFPSLLRRYASGLPAEISSLLDARKQLSLAKQHVGQMGSAFPLSISQREALHHFLNMENGEILAVNGPPGTGKTTLIQSIVATLWVKAALAGSEPPIIVAASTNNQAVRNVIQSFGYATTQSDGVDARWIPDVTSYGLYCVSTSKAQQSSEFQVEFTNSAKTGIGFNAQLESPVFVHNATVRFLDCFEQHFGNRPSSIEQAAQILRQRLIDTVQQLQNGLQVRGEMQSLREEGFAAYQAYGGRDGYLGFQKACLADVEKQIGRHKTIFDDWRKLVRSDPLLTSLFDYLPPIKRRLAKRNQAFLVQQGLPSDTPHTSYREVDSYFKGQWQELQAKLTSAQNTMQLAEADKQRFDALVQKYQQWCAQHGIQTPDEDPAEKLDTTLRFTAFELATHYWEARWLMDMQQVVARGQQEGSLRLQQERKWRRYAKITPCFVSTLHMAPRFFSVWEHNQSVPLFEYIDLLIIDEAGQVAPEVAGASFALAKKALVVGDVKQIEPVWSVTEQVDNGNLKRSGVARSEEQQSSVRAAGLAAAGGSVMVIAQRASQYQKFPDQRGMFLAEHRRCVPEIIAYCNELAYHGRLVPLRPSEKHRILPALGYAHVSGTCERSRGSRENVIEAETIARWIEQERSGFEEFYDKPIEEIIGIVTPFVRQSERIKAALRRSKSNLTKLTVGTVHALQGAERHIVLFSPVYSEKDNYFFDRSVHMLNVAVSRAKDSFLVFGNMSIFDRTAEPSSRRLFPSSLLARYMFGDPANEITNIPLPERQLSGAKPNIRRISTLNHHRAVLTESLKQAQHRVLIVSPFIREKAIKDDRLDLLIRDAVQRGVEVSIFTNDQLDYDQYGKQLKRGVAEGRALLKASGAHVHIVSRIHNKTLCVDERRLIEGSFNWLSAARDEGYRYQNHEVSIQYEGPGVEAFIAQAIEEMQGKRLGVIAA